MSCSRFANPRHHRLQLQAGDFRFHPLGPGIRFFAGAADAFQRPVPPSLVISHVAIFLKMNLSQPLHVRHAIPTRHDEPNREALAPGERLTIQRICQYRFWSHGIFQGQTAAKLLLQLKSLLPEDDILLAMIAAEENHFASLRRDSNLLQDSAEGNPGELPAGRQSLHASGTIAGTFVARNHVNGLHFLQILERKLDILTNHPGELQAVGDRIHLRLVKVLNGKKLVGWRDEAIDLTDIQKPGDRVGVIRIEGLRVVGELGIGFTLRQRRHRPARDGSQEGGGLHGISQGLATCRSGHLDRVHGLCRVHRRYSFTRHRRAQLLRSWL